jgi:hypothetical protein
VVRVKFKNHRKLDYVEWIFFHIMKAVTPLFFILAYLPLIAEPLVVGRYQVQRRGFYYYLPNQDSRFTGKAVSHYFNGQKATESNYKDGMQVGLSTQWYENGVKEWQETYKDNLRNGLETSWYEDGQKKEEGNYKDNKKDGLWTSWRSYGHKFLEINYKDGKQDGLWTSWHSNGQKKEEVNYRLREKIIEDTKNHSAYCVCRDCRLKRMNNSGSLFPD